MKDILINKSIIKRLSQVIITLAMLWSLLLLTSLTVYAGEYLTVGNKKYIEFCNTGFNDTTANAYNCN